MKQILLRWTPVLIWCGIIFFLSAQPKLPGPENGNLDFLVKKIGHITVYAVLFKLVYRSWGGKTEHRIAQTFLFCVLYAVSDEYHQSFVPGRTPMIRDIGFDVIGMLLSSAMLTQKNHH